jgi:hypothetical protein
MGDELAIALISLVVGATLRPLIDRMVVDPGRKKRVLRRVERAWVDHLVWVQRRERQMLEEKAAVDEDAAARGLVGGGIQTSGHREAERRCREEVRDDRIKSMRLVEDALGELGTIEMWWTRLTVGGDRSVPVERRLIAHAQELVEKEERDEEEDS